MAEDAGARPEPAWVEHAIWWQVYPLGFLGALPDRPDHQPRTLRSLIPWLDYATDLGCSGLALGPIFASETHGYDTTDHFRIDPRIGTDEDFDALVDELRGRGLRLLLDGVFNHVARSFPRLQRALDGSDSDGQWFRGWRAGDPNPPLEVFEGHDNLVVLNHDSPAVAGYVGDVMAHWLERGADGWRLDAAYAVPPAFWARVLPGVRERFGDSYVVGEVIHGDYTAYVQESGLDSVTQYELWKAIWSALNDGNFFELAWSLQRHDDYVRDFAPLTFVGNHDVTRIASKLTDQRHLAHALVFLMTIGGTPTLYYGDEQGFTGVKEERFGGDDEVRPEFPEAGPIVLSQLGWPIYRLHQQLVGMRRRHPWLHRATTTQVALANEQFVYRIQSGETALVVGLNVSEDYYELALDEPHVEVDTSSPGTGLDDEGTALVIGPHDWAVLAPTR